MIIRTIFEVEIGHSITVQWYKDTIPLVDGTSGGTAVSGATITFTATQVENTVDLTILNPSVAFDGNYTATVTDNTVGNCERTTQGVEVVIPICRLEITVQPVDVTTDAGSTVQFTTSYDGDVGTVSVQWYKDDVALVDGPTGTGSTISGATTTTLTITTSGEDDEGSYRATVTDDAFPDCSAQTDAATATIGAECALEITTQPVGGDFEVGDEIVMTVAHTGEVGTVTYQWFLNGVPLTDGPAGDATISGALTDTLTITNAQEAQTGSYTVQLTDDGVADCVVQSTVAEVTVTPPQPPANMYIWYKSDGETRFSDGEIVNPPIQDFSGNDLDLTVDSSGTDIPLYETNSLNGLPVFEYPGPVGSGSDISSFNTVIYSLAGIGFPITSTGITLAVVCRRDNQNNLYDPMTVTGLDGLVTTRARITSDGSPTDMTYTAHGYSTSAAVTVPLGAWQIITFTFDFVEGIPRIRSNDLTAAGAAGAGTPNLNQTQMQMCAVGAIAEILAYNTKLSDADLDQLRNYLSVKWGIPITV